MTSQIAAITGVAKWTASNWIESGKLSGPRDSGTGERLIPRERLIRFMYEMYIPLDGLLEAWDGDLEGFPHGRVTS